MAKTTAQQITIQFSFFFSTITSIEIPKLPPPFIPYKQKSREYSHDAIEHRCSNPKYRKTISPHFPKRRTAGPKLDGRPACLRTNCQLIASLFIYLFMFFVKTSFYFRAVRGEGVCICCNHS